MFNDPSEAEALVVGHRQLKIDRMHSIDNFQLSIVNSWGWLGWIRKMAVHFFESPFKKSVASNF
jgi:hypothetical protein